jgi:hypothetical protein
MSQKIGEGSLQAWMRAGFKELGQVLPAFNDGIKPVEEYGLFGNLKAPSFEEQSLKQPELEIER